MKLWEYTGEELIGGAHIKSDFFFASKIEMPWESDKVEGIASMPNYATAPATGHRGLADLERDGDGWKCVGHYVDDIIIVFPRAQNIGIADVLFLITAAFSASGLRLLKRVHRSEVEKAIRHGCSVPERVLKEFHDLKDEAQ